MYMAEAIRASDSILSAFVPFLLLHNRNADTPINADTATPATTPPAFAFGGVAVTVALATTDGFDGLPVDTPSSVPLRVGIVDESKREIPERRG